MPDPRDEFPGAAEVNHPVARAVRWGRWPGGLDVTRGRVIWPSQNPWGIPTVRRDDCLPDLLRPYCSSDKRPPAPRQHEGLHFFTDDYRFETVWTRAQQTLSRIRAFGYSLTPDFSTRIGHPLAVIAYQVYRNRWLGAYWQGFGVHVTPAVNWALPDSYDICFAGLEPGQTVAICTTSSLIDDSVSEWLRRGCLELVNRIKPERLLVYGDPLALPPLPKQLQVLHHAPSTPRNRTRRVAHWYCCVRQPNGRHSIFDVDRAEFCRMNLTDQGLWRQLSTWMPSADAQHLIETGSSAPDQDACRTFEQCLDAVERRAGPAERERFRALGSEPRRS